MEMGDGHAQPGDGEGESACALRIEADDSVSQMEAGGKRSAEAGWLQGSAHQAARCGSAEKPKEEEEEQEEDGFVPDSEDEGDPAAASGWCCGVSGPVRGLVAHTGCAMEGAGGDDDDRGALTQLLEHLSESEDERDERASCSESGGAADQRAPTPAAALPRAHGGPDGRSSRAAQQEEEEGGGASRDDACGEVQALVASTLHGLSPRARATAKTAVEASVAAAVENFASTRAAIVARAEDEIARVRARMQVELEEADARHAANMHDAVVVALRHVNEGCASSDAVVGSLDMRDDAQ